ncbi:MAG: preprotein translocase subunit SecY [Eubacteriales bacterium]|nr:preprotein translocase subunit SecY [Eubacteriales bacterium]
MAGMLETIGNAWKIPDLRKKIFYTIALLLVFRMGSFIPVPGLDPAAFAALVEQGGSLFGFIDIITGGAFKLATIFAMSITPYINSSIIMNLLTVAIPKLEQLAKEGEEGRKKLAQWTRYGTVILGFVQATGLYFGLGSSIVGGRSILSFITITLTFTAGTAFLMWLGEQITEYGIGNGISLIIFAGIVSRGPSGVATLFEYYRLGRLGAGLFGIASLILIAALFVVVIAAVVWVQQAERRIPVQYAKRVIGRKMYGGQSTHIPIKVNLAGVIPIIFAMSIMMFPSTIVGYFGIGSESKIVDFFMEWPNHLSYSLISALLVVFFTFFYTMIQFNPIEIANNMKKNGGFIPGIRPGKPTSDYLSRVLNRITWFGALFLALVQILPAILGYATKIQGIWFAGPGVLILVNVALDTIKQMESQMLMRHYKGFLE